MLLDIPVVPLPSEADDEAQIPSVPIQIPSVPIKLCRSGGRPKC